MWNIILSKVYWLPSGIKGFLVAQGKESTYNVGDLGLLLGAGRSPGEGNGNPLQYSCLGNPMDRWRSLDSYSPWCRKDSGMKMWLTYKNHSPGGASGKEPACHARDLYKRSGSIPQDWRRSRGLGRCPGEGNGNPLQYSCLEDPIDKGAWKATVHKISKSSDTTEVT